MKAKSAGSSSVFTQEKLFLRREKIGDLQSQDIMSEPSLPVAAAWCSLLLLLRRGALISGNCVFTAEMRHRLEEFPASGC